MTVNECCRLAYEASGYIAGLDTAAKNDMLRIVADCMVSRADEILAANAADLAANADKPKHLLDRLMLDEKRLEGIAEGVRKLIALPDPVGEIIAEWTVPSGLRIRKVRVPLGVIGIIYEARPNVTADAISLCLKTGNSVVLRGGSDAIRSNRAIVSVIKAALTEAGYNAGCIQFIDDTTHAGAEALMCCREYVSVLIPRGSAQLINTVVEKSSVPVIETGAGNCHAYIEATADIPMAVNIIVNGKTQRPSVCNALESVLVDRAIAAEALPPVLGALTERGVEIRGCEETRKIFPAALPATEDDYYREYHGLVISVKAVSGVDEAVAHINKYGTRHSEVIITGSEAAAEKFLKGVDSAAVYVNASTRFTDGFEFGFGAEMGISTQKLHARGPLGLPQLTSEKYEIFGQGQIRQ